jgi:hypothetical protein
MTSTLELFPPGGPFTQPPMPAEAATDVSPAENVAEPSPISPEAIPAGASEINPQIAAEREQLRDRIGRSNSLPRGMRERLTALLDGEASAATADFQPLVRATDVLNLLEEAIPPQLRLEANSLAQPEHPAGEGFFTGDPHQMTDDQAERIAREQISRSPFGRSQ